MKRLLLTLGLGLTVAHVSAQFVNNGAIHISDGAVVSVGMETINNGVLENRGTLELKDNVQNNASLVSGGVLELRSQSGIRLAGKNGIEASTVILDSDVQLQSPIKVGKSLEFANGIIYTAEGASVEFGANATHASSSDFSHVAGSVKKSGNGSFSFPVGDGYSKKSFQVSDLAGRIVEAKYSPVSPLDLSSELDYDVEEINTQEYWIIKASQSSKLGVSLSNSDVVALNKGVWAKGNNGISVGNADAVFTSGKGKNFVKEIGVWPNPTSGEFNLKLTGMRDTDDITVDITNQDGRVIQSLKGKVSELRKAYRLPTSLATTNLKVRVINGDEVLTQSLILNK